MVVQQADDDDDDDGSMLGNWLFQQADDDDEDEDDEEQSPVDADDPEVVDLTAGEAGAEVAGPGGDLTMYSDDEQATGAAPEITLRVACLDGSTLDLNVPPRALVREVKQTIGQVRRRPGTAFPSFLFCFPSFN
jgi:hypothetical protein